MNRTLRNVALFFAMLVAVAVSAQNTLTFGYCNNEITDDDYRISSQYDLSVMGALRLPAAQLASLKGKNAKITKIRIGAEAGMEKTYVWVRPSLDKAAAALQRVGTTGDGWNEVTLTKPYEITGDNDLYIGFNSSLPAGTSLILNGKTSDNGCYLATNGMWDNISNMQAGSLCIQAVVESEGELPANDLGVELVTMDTKYARNGDVRRFYVTVANYGRKDATLGTFHYQVAGGKEQTAVPAESVTLTPGDTYVKYIDAEIEGVDEGYADMKIWIDSDDDCAANNSYTERFCAYTTSYDHKMLMEQFTTLSCVNCPYGHNLFKALAGTRDNVVWVAHHVGYGSDQFTISASEDIMAYGIASAPLGMFDRSYLEGLSENNKPPFSIGYSRLSTGVKALSPFFDEVLNRPAFVKVDIKPEYDKDTRILSVKVSGERNGLFGQLYDKSNLTVYLVEDSCVSKRPQTGGEPSDTIHNHVVREALTASFGDAIEWSGNGFEKTYQTVVNKSWKDKDIKVVAFVHRPAEGYKDCEVLNTESVPMLATTDGVSGVKADKGRVVSRAYYNLQGQRLVSVPAHGAYIERTQYEDGVTSEKHVVK